MRAGLLAAVLVAFAGAASAAPGAPEPAARAEFLFIGSFHMGNPGRDVHNTRADDMLGSKRQAEIADVVRLIERYRPTKVMVEVDAGKQSSLDARYAGSCRGSRPLEKNETEQLGFRIACELGLAAVNAVDWNELGPIKDEDSVDYVQAVARHQQQAQYDAHMAIGKAQNEKSQQLLDRGSVLQMLAYLNSEDYLEQNAKAYYRIGMFGTPSDPIGANWVQLWFGRNLAIFNNITRHTEPGDRVLVIYGAGHGNYLRRLALDSGLYRVHEPLEWLSPDAGRHAPQAAPRPR